MHYTNETTTKPLHNRALEADGVGLKKERVKCTLHTHTTSQRKGKMEECHSGAKRLNRPLSLPYQINGTKGRGSRRENNGKTAFFLDDFEVIRKMNE